MAPVRHASAARAAPAMATLAEIKADSGVTAYAPRVSTRCLHACSRAAVDTEARRAHDKLSQRVLPYCRSWLRIIRPRCIQTGRRLKNPTQHRSSARPPPDAVFSPVYHIAHPPRRYAGRSAILTPLSLMTNPAQLEKYSLYKESEIKHGRVAMLAAPGFLIAEKFHPLFGGNVDAPSILAFQQTPLQTIWPIVLLVIGAIEGYSSVSTYKDPSTAAWSIKEDHLAGDLGMFGGAKQAKSNPAGYKALATKEINNGRLAMMAIAGMVVQELVFHVKL
eukprot:CAMPEP_0179839416 /NCGR_PEP_ID=MMETSP0982-20121206/1309_1 /TAXON_ID=483367 /ORGANISM="non described non described, Strain CCMP 2436" /LENGTH=276 /DNA_ID=CAMNT_0021723075 /DNA_START=121 /DNA_END=951 /DNA_ORIENTATION=+